MGGLQSSVLKNNTITMLVIGLVYRHDAQKEWRRGGSGDLLLTLAPGPPN